MSSINRRNLTHSLILGGLSGIAPATSHAFWPIGLSPLDWAELLNGLRIGLAHRALPAQEVALMTKLRTLANDWSQVQALMGPNPNTNLGLIEQAMQARMRQAQEQARAMLGNDPSRVVLAQNAYILMSYDALVRHNPDFFWSQLGIFAANEVRANLALAFTLKNTLDHMVAKAPRLANAALLPGISIASAAKMAQQATADLIDGQSRVLANIGTLALLHKRHGAVAMSKTGVSEPARQGFVIQAKADAALQARQTQRYRDLSTEAAIQFGIHEQTNELQSMWERPSMKGMAQINHKLLKISAEQIGMRGDIFVGTNKMAPFIGPYLIIRAAFGATDLSSLQDRIAIAMNGFKTLNKWRSNLALNGWIVQSRTRLGRGDGLYRPVIQG